MPRSDRYSAATLTFVALDFETADVTPGSACAVGIVSVRRGRIASVVGWKIRPPGNPDFRFTPLHGIGEQDVAAAPDTWRTAGFIGMQLLAAEFVAAHHAKFDARVLDHLSARHGVALPRRPFVCSARLFRLVFPGGKADLPSCARRLDIPLRHHDARSDAVTSARIVMGAARTRLGRRFLSGLVETTRVWT